MDVYETELPIRVDLLAAHRDVVARRAVAVSANFHMMTRIADGTGTPFDATAMERSEEIRAQIGVNDFASRREVAGS
ncbi:MAG: hypothetical protein O3B90_11865 [Actinomycetota bacterium]|nr:hypothetical protein [Actinomycetota bacterium]